MVALDAAVIGLMEIENDGYADTSAIADLVTGLRSASGNDSWQYIDAGGPVGTDEIAVGIIYRADLVTPAAALLVLDSANSAVDEQGQPLFDDNRNRPMLAQAGYSNVFEVLGKVPGHGYVFSGQSGALDHALLNAKALQYLADATKWNINADEPVALDYNVESKSAQQQLDYYAADAYRSSDHDPVVVSFNLPAVIPPLDVTLELLRTIRSRSGQSLVQLRWDGGMTDLTLYRDNVAVRGLNRSGRVNDNFRSDAISVTYKICQQATAHCSADLVANFD